MDRPVPPPQQTILRLTLQLLLLVVLLWRFWLDILAVQRNHKNRDGPMGPSLYVCVYSFVAPGSGGEYAFSSARGPVFPRYSSVSRGRPRLFSPRRTSRLTTL